MQDKEIRCRHCNKKTRADQEQCSYCQKYLKSEETYISPSQLIDDSTKEIVDLFIPESIKAEKFGRYQIVEEIGRGGMGLVYKAYDPELDRDIALKLILAGEDSKPKDLARFLREAKATAKLRHPGIVAVYDMGQKENQPFFTMEYLEGVSLKECVRDSDLSLCQSVEILKQVAQAVAYAHQEGVIHRDLKPANIMIENSQAKVMDFGLAKVEKASDKISQSGMVIGTLQYMPPEQAQGRSEKVDKRSDVYSLGAILYEMMTGVPPFGGSNWSQTLYQVLYEKPLPPTKLQKNVSGQLEKICLKALEKKQERRYQNVEELISDLDHFLEGKRKKFPTPSKRILLGVLTLAFLLFFILQTFSFSLQKATEKSFSPPDVFFYMQTETYFAGNQSHTVKQYQHKPTGIEFILIPGGSFMMGSEDSQNQKPVHQVKVKSFLLSKYEITQEQWERVMRNNPSTFKGAKKPVEEVSWDDVKEFCLKTGLSLPSEAQWEYACRAGTKTKYYWGDSTNKDYMHYSSSKTAEVGSKKPNAFGLYDMSGNVYEWCEDKWHPNYSGAPIDSLAWNSKGSLDRVYRGGCWYDFGSNCESTDRYHYSPEKASNDLGFRVAFSED